MGVLGERDTGRTLWVGLGAVIAAVIAFALFKYVGAFLFAIFLYYATRPLYRRLEGRIAHPNVRVAVTLLIVVLPMVIVVSYTLLVAVQELSQVLSGDSLEPYRQSLEPYLTLASEGSFGELRQQIPTSFGQLQSGSGGSALGNILGQFAAIAGFLLAAVARSFLMIVFVFYLLRDDYKIREWFYRSVDYDDDIVQFTSAVDDDLETVFFNNLAVVGLSAVLATAVYLGLNLLAQGGTIVGSPVLLGTLTGLGMLIPLVGMKLVYLPYAAYLTVLAATTQTPFWHPLLFLAVSSLVVDVVPDFFIRSYLSAGGHLHMGLILLGYLLGTMAFGWYGLFLGPIIVVFTVHFANSVFPRLAGGAVAE